MNSDSDNDIGNDADNDADNDASNDIGNDNGNYHENNTGNDTNNDAGYDVGHDTGHDTGNEIHEDGDESLPSSKSRLKVFQKHDTYTNCRLEDLLGSMVKGSGQSTTHSTTGFQSHSEPATETDNSEIQDDTDEIYSSTQTRHWNSADRRDITTQDFMDNAESLMKKLMGSAPGDLEDTDAEEVTGVKEEPSQFQTDSYESVDSEAEDYTNSQKYQIYEQNDYLRSDTVNTNEYQNSELPESLDLEDPASSHLHNGRLGPPAHVSAPKSIMRQNIKVIKQEDIKGIIPSIIGSMNYDEQNRKWHHHNEIHQHNRFDSSMNSRANVTDEHDIFHGIDDLSDTRPGSPSIRSQHSSDPISHSHFTQVQSTTNGNYENHNNIINKKFFINNNIINQYEPGILGLENEEGLDFQQKLQSIKGCLIETPRSIQFPGTFDKEVSFALPPDHSSTERHDKSLISPVLLNNVAYSGIHPLSTDITHISQIDSSFSHSMSHLVEVFTTRYPNQMLWDKLTSVNISNGTLESLARLNTICPFLKTLDASHNNISILQGIPFSVTRLDVSHNSLTNLSNFGGLDNIQYLNVAFNDIETFNCLSHLSHLRELIADGCPVTNLNGLSRIDGLLKLSVKGGQLEVLDGAELKLSLLQTLNLCSNKIRRVDRLEQLVSLRSLDLGKFRRRIFFFFFLLTLYSADSNKITTMIINDDCKILSKLSLRNNELEDISQISPGALKFLHLENNPKCQIESFNSFKSLNSLSLDYSSISYPGSLISLRQISDVSNLKIINNPSSLMSTPYAIKFDDYFMNLQRLDLSGLGLKVLPANMNSFLLNLREVNLSFNQLTSLEGLKGMPKLTHVLLYGNKIEHINECLDFTRNTKNLKLCDLRENKLTKKFYPNLFECLNMAHANGNIAAHGSISNNGASFEDAEVRQDGQLKTYLKSISRKYQTEWCDSDTKYLKDLEKFDTSLYNKRIGYQGLLVSTNKNLKWLDGTILDDDRINMIKKHWSLILGQARENLA